MLYFSYNWQALCQYDGGGALKETFVYGNYIDEVLFKVPLFYMHDHLYSPVALVHWLGSVLERYEYDAYGNCYVMDASYNPRTKSSYGNPYYFTGRNLDVLDNSGLKIMYYRNRFYDSYTGRFTTHDPLGITPNPSILSKKHDTIDRYAHNKYNNTDSYRWLKSQLLKVQSNRERSLSLWPKSQYGDVINLFEYGGSNPIIYLDPYGLEKCNCGPSIDGALMKLDMALYRAWKSWGLWERIKRCTWMYEPTAWLGGWDIAELSRYRTAPETKCCPSSGSCRNTVTVCGNCYPIDAANFWLWGTINKYCGKDRYEMIADIYLWEKLGPSKEEIEWAKAGYEGRFCAGSSKANKVCKPCSTRWTGPLHYQWGTGSAKDEFTPGDIYTVVEH